MGFAGRALVPLTEELVRGVMGIGVSPATVEAYRSACNGFLGFARMRCETTWSAELASAYVAHIDDRLDRGDISRTYHRFQRRVLRVLSSIAEGGEADFSRAQGKPVKYPVSDAVGAVVEQILAAKCHCEATRAVLRPTVRHLLWYAAERHIGPFEVDDSLVMEFLVSEVPATNAGSAGRALRAVSYAAMWLREHDGRVLRDYSMLTLRSEGRRIIPAFTEAEVRSVVGAIDASTAKGKRDRAVVLLAYCTGLRSRDILSLKLDEVDWRRQRITTTQSKTHKPITCELNGETMNALAEYVLEARPECRLRELFLTVRAPHRAIAADQVSCWFDGLCERAGVEKVPGRSFHSLRRSFETVLLSRGVGIDTVSHMVGHSSINEDKPYITYDGARSAHVAMDFSDVPVRVGAYAGDGR